MNILSRFQNTSIKAKVVSLTMLLVTFTMTIALGLMLFIEYREMKKVLINDTNNLARIIANRSSIAVSFMDKKVAMENLTALSESENIQQAAIFDFSGQVFASYQREGAPETITSQRMQVGVRADFSVINITREITQGDELLGHLFLQSNLSPVWGALRSSLIYTVFLYLFCLLLSFALSIRLQRYVTLPILSLLNTSKKISSEQRYEFRAEKTGDDEIGNLVDQFNEMLSIIQRDEEALKNANTELEQKVSKRTEDLAQALRESKAANKAKSGFLSQMSHELLTPLNAINGYSQLLMRQQNLTTVQRKQLETVYKSGDHLLKLIHDVLDYSQVESDHNEIYIAPLNLQRLVSRVSDMVRLQAEEKGLEFHFVPSSELPEVVNGDEKRISQVLLNLLNNAIKYTVEGRIDFRVYPQKGSYVIFEVQDTGVGISEKIKEQVFAPFFRASKTKKMVDGLGLGMAISREFVSLMNGEILLESEEGVGSTFRVRLPLEPATRQPPSNSRYAQIKAYTGTRKKLLLVDDDISNLSVLVSILEPIGFEIRTVDRGVNVCRAVEEFRPDALFLDLKMPNTDGIQVLKDLTKTNYTGKVIGISGTSLETLRKTRFASKCDDFLKKPVDADQLIRSLEASLEIKWTLNAEANPRPTENRNLPASKHSLPPSEVIQELKDYIEEGNFNALTKCLANHRDTQTEHTEFYNAALIKAENYDDESLLELLS
jgi:signal transduction histidine kinase/FixJ family two-component response regulator